MWILKKLPIMLASLVFAAGIYAEEDIEGRWMTIDDETGKPRSYIKIWVENGVAYGSIEKIIPLKPDENTNPRCTECKGEDYNKPVVGMTILRGLRKDGDEWTGGTILDPNNGKTYKCKIKADKNGKTLKVRGYIGFSLIGRTQIWRRAE